MNKTKSKSDNERLRPQVFTFAEQNAVGSFCLQFVGDQLGPINEYVTIVIDGRKRQCACTAPEQNVHQLLTKTFCTHNNRTLT